MTEILTHGYSSESTFYMTAEKSVTLHTDRSFCFTAAWSTIPFEACEKVFNDLVSFSK